MNTEYVSPQTVKVNHIVKCPTEGVFTDPTPEVAFTIVRSDQTPLTKIFEAGLNGVPMKSRDAGMSAGTARRVVLRGTAAAMMRQLADILSSLSQHEALIPAPPPAGKVEWKLVTKDELVKHPGAVARTKEFFIPTVGLGLLGLDLDMKTYPRTSCSD